MTDRELRGISNGVLVGENGINLGVIYLRCTTVNGNDRQRPFTQSNKRTHSHLATASPLSDFTETKD